MNLYTRFSTVENSWIVENFMESGSSLSAPGERAVKTVETALVESGVYLFLMFLMISSMMAF